MNQSTEAQCERMLKRLQKGPASTIALRHEEDIFSPPPRAYELRHKHGYNIITHWTTAHNPGGKSHRVAMYVLLPGKYKGGK